MESSVRDYRLNERNNQNARAKGLVEAQWYESPVSKSAMRFLLERRNWPAARDMIIWLSLLLLTGWAGAMLWPTYWAAIPFALYGVLYASSSDSRWHEFSHGTVFKTDWLNDVFYEIASFMVFRESSVWKWSHHRHHSDTLVLGRDPEITIKRPPNVIAIMFAFTGIPGTFSALKSMLFHSTGRLTEEEQLFIPAEEQYKVSTKARIYLAIYTSVITAAILLNSLLPLMLIGLPTFYGSWLMPIYGLTQHTGLSENQLDHRFNTRTVHMNLINRFLYWNMGFHVEHHMYPMVPYYNLPELHKLIKKDCPKAYSSLWEAWKEILPAIMQQRRDSNYYVSRSLPDTAQPSGTQKVNTAYLAKGARDTEGWIEVDADAPKQEAVIRFDHNEESYAIYRTQSNKLCATDGFCTHGNAHLAEGLVTGSLIECPKHNGRFDVTDGSCQRLPVSVPLKIHDVKESADGKLFVKLENEQSSNKPSITSVSYKVLENRYVTPFIKELTIAAIDTEIKHKAGDFIQFNIPPFEKIAFDQFKIPAKYIEHWLKSDLFSLSACNEQLCRRNYSIASAPGNKILRFTVRIALSPENKGYPAGVGSTYIFSLKPGDEITGSKPTGTFHIAQNKKEMIYVGGGAGMAPIRAHLEQLFENQCTQRKVSYWYGARTPLDIFYQGYFTSLQQKNKNFSFNIALSEPCKKNNWIGHTGFIHQVLETQYLKNHSAPANAEYYLCGPPRMIEAMDTLLKRYCVPKRAITYDIF